MRKTRPILVFGLAVAFAVPAAAAEGPGAAPRLDGAALDLLWVVPFLGILLSIAVLPQIAPHFWHRHFGKVSAFWALAFAVPSLLVYGVQVSLYEILHTLLLDYIPFIILLLSLFTVAGGVRLKGSLRGTPLVNTAMLFTGTVLASWMGTTGAAMLLIRPVIRANSWRKNNVHVIIFFIFLVANIGGSLTPLGDPPLFLGFLQGVDFFWPTTRMFLPMCLVAGILLALFYVLDSYLFRGEGKPPEEGGEERFGIEGGINILLLAGIAGAVLMSGVWKPGIGFEVHHVRIELQNIVRDVLLVVLTFVSWRMTSLESRQANAFTWFPIIEVGKLFGGIFLTIIPVLAILRAGTDGALGGVVSAVSSEGQPVNVLYFWLTGAFSSFLDNAPTYLLFFNIAGGDADQLMGPLGNTLLAISAGAVFFGANTYIGNAPNFMVRSIAQERGIKMPSFFGFMGWSCLILLPLYALVSLIWFA